jgi:hypothetical protein
MPLPITATELICRECTVGDDDKSRAAAENISLLCGKRFIILFMFVALEYYELQNCFLPYQVCFYKVQAKFNSSLVQ